MSENDILSDQEFLFACYDAFSGSHTKTIVEAQEKVLAHNAALKKELAVRDRAIDILTSLSECLGEDCPPSGGINCWIDGNDCCDVIREYVLSKARKEESNGHSED